MGLNGVGWEIRRVAKGCSTLQEVTRAHLGRGRSLWWKLDSRATVLPRDAFRRPAAARDDAIAAWRRFCFSRGSRCRVANLASTPTWRTPPKRVH